jgi:hypothetical protein
VRPASLHLNPLENSTHPEPIRDGPGDATDDHLGQLADRMALYARGAELTRLAVYDGDEIVAQRICTSIVWTTSLNSRTW